MYRIYIFAVLVIYSTYLINILALKRFQTSKRNVQYENVYKSVNVLWMVKHEALELVLPRAQMTLIVGP